MKSFMLAQPLCVIATVGDTSKPEAAYVGFSHNDKLELLVGTSNKSRKYANLVKNPSVAVVIADTSAEVQYEGEAAEIADAEYRLLVEQQHIKKLPGAAKYRQDPDQIYIKITPSWIRFIKHGETDSIEEFTEFA